MVRLSNDTRRARLAWLSLNNAPDETVRDALNAARYELATEDEARHPELTLVDLRGANREQINAIETSQADFGRPAPVVFLIDQEPPAALRQSLSPHGPVVPFAPNYSSALKTAIGDQLRARRLKQEAGDVEDAHAAISRKQDLESETNRILIAAKPSPTSLSAFSTIRRGGWTPESALNAGQSFAALESGGYDAAVFAPSESSDPLYAVADALRRRRKAETTPIIFIDANGSAAGRTTLSPDAAEDELTAILRARIQEARCGRRQRGALDAIKALAIGGGAPCAAIASSSARYVSCLDQRARALDLPLSYIGVHRLAPIDETACDEGPPPLDAAARLIPGVSRASDFLWRVTPSFSILALPGAPRVDAIGAASRISAVVAECAHRQLFSNGAPVNGAGAVETVVADWRDGGCLEEVVARLLSTATRAAPRAQRRAS